MSTTTDDPPDAAPDEDDVALPDYAAAVAACGDPQPTRDALNAELADQTPPVISPEYVAEESDDQDPEDETEKSDQADDEDGGSADD